MIAACQGRTALFDSIDIADHYRARNICAECPVLAECFRACREATASARFDAGPRGTWAGELMTRDRIGRMKVGMRDK